jgi:enamine deaminase RidA (YjgF/YER057c/UK114 family)
MNDLKYRHRFASSLHANNHAQDKTMTLVQEPNQTAATTRRAVFPPGRQELYTRNKYSAAISAGGFLFVSGQVGSREDGSPEPDLEQQARLAFTNLNNTLAAAGCSMDDVVDFTVYIVEPEKTLPAFFKVRDEFWGAPPYPTLTGIGVTWLYGFQFELKVIAKLPDNTNNAAKAQ